MNAITIVRYNKFRETRHEAGPCCFSGVKHGPVHLNLFRLKNKQRHRFGLNRDGNQCDLLGANHVAMVGLLCDKLFVAL